MRKKGEEMIDFIQLNINIISQTFHTDFKTLISITENNLRKFGQPKLFV